MQITFIKPFHDPGNCVFQTGETATMADPRAQTLIHHGIALPVIEIVPVEKAVPKKRKRETR